jgi:serine/threonine protein phosphatase PrpC
MKSIIYTHPGKREVNQDFVLAQNLKSDVFLFLVADGMGGYENGEIASRLVAENVSTHLSTAINVEINDIQKAINKANLVIRQFKEKSGQKLGATVGGVVLTSNQALCFWVGDVKIFHFKNNKLQNESHSHTLMNEVLDNSSIVDTKQLNKYRHVVTRSVQGKVDRSKIDCFKISGFDDTDSLFVCSDGVTDVISGTQIEHIFNSAITHTEAMKIIENRLISEANDNFSMILVNFE